MPSVSYGNMIAVYWEFLNRPINDIHLYDLIAYTFVITMLIMWTWRPAPQYLILDKSTNEVVGTYEPPEKNDVVADDTDSEDQDVTDHDSDDDNANNDANANDDDDSSSDYNPESDLDMSDDSSDE